MGSILQNDEKHNAFDKCIWTFIAHLNYFKSIDLSLLMLVDTNPIIFHAFLFIHCAFTDVNRFLFILNMYSYVDINIY